MSTTDLGKTPHDRATLDKAPAGDARVAPGTIHQRDSAAPEDGWAFLRTPLEIGVVLVRIVELTLSAGG